MTNSTHRLNREVGDQKIFRRDFQKADGRMLRLYGYSPHKEEPCREQIDEVAKGGELRWHPLRQEWNIYAAHRQKRTFKPSPANDPLAPSLPGQPATEIPFASYELAAFENKFTSLHPEAENPNQTELFVSEPARGVCEVIVYGPESDGSITTIGQAKRRLLIAAWIDRYEALRSEQTPFVLPFENRGDEVGVTLHHPHGQIYAFPFIPRAQLQAANAFNEGFDLAKYLNDLEDCYVIAREGALCAFCPPFARYPFEVWIASEVRVAGPWEFSESQQEGYAKLLSLVCERYDDFFGQPTPYMMSLHAAPYGYEKHFHFVTQFYPILRAPGRLKYFASVEHATGAFTVDVMPEMAAQLLSKARP